MIESPPVLVTRAEPGNAATMARATAAGLDAQAIPLFAAVRVDWQLPDPADHDILLLTSAQAVRLAGPRLASLASLPVYAVGAATAAAAREAGLNVAATGTRDAQALINAIALQKNQRILWLCGRDRSDPDTRDAQLLPLPCYAVNPVDPPSGWDDLIAEPAILLAHSARGAARIAALTEGRRAALSLVAISPAVAAMAGGGWAIVTVTDRPDDAAMVTAAVELCKKAQK